MTPFSVSSTHVRAFDFVVHYLSDYIGQYTPAPASDVRIARGHSVDNQLKAQFA
ncbi:MAG: hypothetical protein ACFE0Q_04520 [Anaerolineae bacterium]